MSDERFEQKEPKDETEDVEAHKKAKTMTDEPRSDDDEGDDVEAHKRSKV